MEKVAEEGKKAARLAMPVTAELVDKLRAAYGAERVNAAIAAGQRAKREFRRLEASQGKRAARAWLSRQKFPQGCFWAEEGGNSVGVQR